MGQKTSIPWTNFTCNPVRAMRKDNGKRGHACIKKSDECKNCYASAINMRWGTGLPFDVPSMELVTPYLNEAEVAWLEKSTAISGKMVFIEDMSDLFGPWVDAKWLDRLFGIFASRADVTFQLLTKWPERMRDYLLSEYKIDDNVTCYQADKSILNNVWLGTTVGTQKRADSNREFMDELSHVGWNTWVSSEPRLEPINWKGWYFLQWMVTGGESGISARRFDVDWARSDLAYCRERGISFFMKQLGGRMGKGEQLADFPEDLRVREFPTSEK
jgi:protein gp37